MAPLDATPLLRAPRAIRNRLVLSVAVLVVFSAVMTGGGFALMGATVGGILDEDRRTNLLFETQESLRVSLVSQEALALGYALAPTEEAFEEFEAVADAEVDAYIELGRIAADDAGILVAARNVRQFAAEWRESWAEPFMRAALEGEPFDEAAVHEASDELFLPVREAIADLRGLSAGRRAASAEKLGAIVGGLQAIFVPAVVLMIILVTGAGAWLIRSISGPLHRLNLTGQALIAGREVTFVPERDDEIGALAVVLERMRLDAAARYATARVEAEVAATFNQLGELTSFAQNEETLVDAATRVLQRIAPSTRGQVMLLNNSTNRLIVAATWGDGLAAVGTAASLDRTDRCPGIRRATAYVAEDVTEDLAVRCPAHPANAGTVVCLPMPALGSIVGVIHLERPEPRSFDALTVQHAARTAEQVALAVANARLMKTMEGMANTDPLTGLRNARFFDAYLEQQFTLVERDRDSIGLIMLDVDHFKQFNDTYGHPAGDEALRALSRTVRSIIRSSDVVARYGGEEFIIALHHAKLADSRAVAEKIRSAIEETVIEIGPGRYGRITASLGVVATDAHRVDRKGLVSLADVALYRAKAAGRNRVETSPTSTAELDEAGQRRLARSDKKPTVLPVARRRRPGAVKTPRSADASS